MGLTVHYTLRHPGPLTADGAAELVATAHRRSAALVKRRQLVGISAINPADFEGQWDSEMVVTKKGGRNLVYDVPPQCGRTFTVHPGRDSESVTTGLCHYPDTLSVGRRKLATGCGGWRYRGFCKTQYASLHGPEHFLKCHRAVIDLLLIWQRLGLEVEIHDEGDYWPGRNEKKLLHEVGYMNQMVAALGGACKDAAEEEGAKIEAPIFAHGQFELLEAQGLAQHANKVEKAVHMFTGAFRASKRS